LARNGRDTTARAVMKKRFAFLATVRAGFPGKLKNRQRILL